MVGGLVALSALLVMVSAWAMMVRLAIRQKRARPDLRPEALREAGWIIVVALAAVALDLCAMGVNR